MASWEFGETLFGVGQSIPLWLPTPDNDNWQLMADWMTPAEFMQWIRRRREQLRRDLAADFTLRACPEHRKTWEITLAMERCALWHYYGMRQG